MSTDSRPFHSRHLHRSWTICHLHFVQNSQSPASGVGLYRNRRGFRPLAHGPVFPEGRQEGDANQDAEEAGKAAVADAKPLSQNEYKVQLAKVAVKRALLQAAGVRA